MTYPWRVFNACSQLLNAVLGGNPNESISGRAYREGWGLRHLINGVFFWQRNHCLSAHLNERQASIDYLAAQVHEDREPATLWWWRLAVDALAVLGIAAILFALLLLAGCSIPVRVVESNPIPVVAPEKPTSWGPDGAVRTSEPVPLPVTPYGGFSATIPASASEPARVVAGSFAPVAPVPAADVPRPVQGVDASGWLGALGALAAALGLPGAGLLAWLLRQKSLLSTALDLAIDYGNSAERVDPAHPTQKRLIQDEHRRKQEAAGVHHIIAKRLERVQA